MNFEGLSTGRAPPAQAPLLLFSLMPFFLGLTGATLVWQGGDMLVSRWTPGILGITHFLVLGVIAPAMCGGLLQLAPVLLDAPYTQVQALAQLTTASLGFGALAIGGGLLFAQHQLLMAGALVTLTGLGTFLVATFHALRRAAARRGLLSAIRIASIALLVTLLLGLTLALMRAGWIALPLPPQWVNTHLAWGLGGWAGLLLAGTATQIIPLFHMCPEFPDWFTRGLAHAVGALLCLATVAVLIPGSAPYGAWILATLLCAHILFHLYALFCEQRRQRPVREADLWLWQVAHLAVTGALIGWIFDAPQLSIGILIMGSVLTFLLGSMLKILPFLTWLDLQQQRISGQHLQVRIPRLRQILPSTLANLIALSLIYSLLLLLGATAWPALTQLGGGLLTACAILMMVALARAIRIHRQLLLVFQHAGDDLPPHT